MLLKIWKKMSDKKKVLLIEPNYPNKFPPVGLMKLATYYRNLGNWEVVFYKGDLRLFVIDRIADKCISEMVEIDPDTEWYVKKDLIVDYIRKRKKEILPEIVPDDNPWQMFLLNCLHEAKDNWWKKYWQSSPEWDRVGITTLFTFYWDITVETINFAKYLVKDIKDLMVGGVLASIQPKELFEATGIRPHVGILNIPGQLDEGDEQIIDNLPLDYSILDEIEYKYPMTNAYYGYTTRGCIRHCAFCAVPTLEPEYNPYIPLKERIELVNKLYGPQRDLLLMDNNVLASENFKNIIQDIIDSGFGKGAKYTQPDVLEISIRNLKNHINDRAYIRKTFELIQSFYSTLKGESSYEVYKIISTYHIGKIQTCTRDNLLKAYSEIEPIYKKHFKPKLVSRYVDFNQGVDSRLFTEENAKLLASIAIRPLRIAFDDIRTLPEYSNALRLSVKAGIKDFSNYLLYNFNDEPIDLYRRLRINVEFCDELNINIYSFPMKYHPIRKKAEDVEDFSHNRDYIGKHWNRKYIRAIQAILNSTKGKVGKGRSFFLEAFGHSEEEYYELLEMPETFILYRFFFRWLDGITGKGADHWRKCWKKCFSSIDEDTKNRVLDVIHKNEFTDSELMSFKEPSVTQLLACYINYRSDIITPGTELYSLKQEFDKISTNK